MAICATAALLLGSPLALYWVGLSGVEGRPQKPRLLASTEQQARTWKQAGGAGIPSICPDNPDSFAASLFLAGKQTTPPGRVLSWWIARDYLSKQKRYSAMI